VIIVVVISLLDLIGWFFNIALLKSILVSWSPMRIITACCFLASTVSVAITVTFQNRSALRFLSSALSMLVFIAGTVTLMAFGADTWLGPETVVYRSQILNFLLSFENRMAMISAILFIVIGIVLGLISLNKEKLREYAHILLIPVMFAGYVVPVRYIIEIHDLDTLMNIPMAFNTAVSFCLLSMAVLGFYPGTRIMRVFTSSFAGSIMARRQIIGLLIIPVVIGWLRLTSERIHLLSSDMGVAFVAVAYTFCLIAIVWWSARSVNETDMSRRDSEEKVRKNEQRLNYHFENSPLAIVEWDESFIVTLWSNEAERMFGWNARETIGKRIDSLNLIVEEDIPVVEKTMQRLLSGQEHTVVSTNRNYTKSGEIIECIWHNSILMEKDGHMNSVMSLVQDVTERKKAEAKLLKLNQTLIALDKCSQAMVRFNDENSFLKEVCHVIIEECIYSMVWIGYALEDADKTVLPMAHFGLDNGYLESQRILWADTERGHGPTGTAIRTGKAVTCRNMLTDPKFLPWREQALKRGYASSIALPLTTNGKTLGALTIYSKVPDSFSDEEIELLTELANDVAYGITAIRWKIAQAKAEEQLKKYAEDLKDLNATKDKFFGIIAHDLKNPFTSILGASEILAANAEEFDLETIKKFSMLLHDAGKTGYAMLENLLEWSRSQTGRLSYIPRKLNVSEIIQQDLNNLTLIAAQKEITLKMSVPEDLYMLADLNITHTILRNLLNNALKFTHRKGLVNIYATHVEEDVIITIKDNGIGISEDDQKKLFRMDVKYSQIGTAEERGTGLGLLLCKEFVEKQGGKIWVKSIEGEGSSFKFTLPAVLPVPSQTASAINSFPPED
jgi:PAS domain S-box-containing protein